MNAPAPMTDVEVQVLELRTQRKALEDQMTELHTKLMGIQYQLDKLQPRTTKPCSHRRRSYEVPMPEVTARALGMLPPAAPRVDGVMLGVIQTEPRIFDPLPEQNVPVFAGLGDEGDEWHGSTCK